jgi:hypothetical protein
MEQLRARLSKMTQADLVKFYDADLQTCRLNHGEPPRAQFIQQLVPMALKSAGSKVGRLERRRII